MNTEQYEKQNGTEPDDAECRSIAKRRERVPVRRESRIEQPQYVERCGFEIVGVTTRPRMSIDIVGAANSDAESEQDRMMSSLVSVLGPGQRVKFIYAGGGRSSLCWHIVGEGSSRESAAQAEERLRNVQHALMTVLESRKSSYRFRALPDGEAGRIGAAKGKWIGAIQPRGTHVRSSKSTVGFRDSSDSVVETDTSVSLPHYTRERARAFSSIVALLMSSPASLRVSITLEACRLNRVQEHAVKAALEVIRDRSMDSDLPAHLEHAAEVWLKNLAGCRMTCEVSSSRLISESFLKMLAGELYHGAVDVHCRRAGAKSGGQNNVPACLPGHVLDLRNCIPSMAPLPLFFPQPEVLARHGMKRFFNRERLTLPKAGALIGCVRDGQTEQPVRLCSKWRSRHLYILGATGTGKSTMMGNITVQDIDRGEGVCLIDPHGPTYRHVLKWIPRERADDVVLLDLSDRERSVGINLLECNGPHREMQANFVINEMVSMLDKMYDMRICGGPMFESYFRAALQLVMADPENPGTLVDVPAVFENKAFRDGMIKKSGSALLAEFWKMAENAGGEARLANISPYIVSKLNLFVHNALLRPIIGQPKSTINFREIIDDRRILLVNLSRGALGELDMHLLGMVVLTKLMCAAMSRQDVAEHRRKPFMTVVDEFQHFTTGATASLLSEARKFGLCLTLANQNLAQLSTGNGKDNLVHSVLGNVGSMALFRLGAPDAEALDMYTRPAFGPAELQTLPNFHACARLLTLTGPTEPFVFQTYPASRRRVDSAVMRKIRKARHAYTASIKTVEENICKRREEIRATGKESDKKDKATDALMSKMFA